MAARACRDSSPDAAVEQLVLVAELFAVRFGFGARIAGDDPVDAALTALLARDDAPTALCFHQDSLAIPLFFRLRQCGMAIPTDLSVTGFDNSTFSGEVGLTTVRQKPYDMAVAAARKALDLIEGRTLDQPHEIFPVQLLVRDSTAAPRVRGDRKSVV